MKRGMLPQSLFAWTLSLGLVSLVAAPAAHAEESGKDAGRDAASKASDQSSFLDDAIRLLGVDRDFGDEDEDGAETVQISAPVRAGEQPRATVDSSPASTADAPASAGHKGHGPKGAAGSSTAAAVESSAGVSSASMASEGEPEGDSFSIECEEYALEHGRDPGDHLATIRVDFDGRRKATRIKLNRLSIGTFPELRWELTAANAEISNFKAKNKIEKFNNKAIRAEYRGGIEDVDVISAWTREGQIFRLFVNDHLNGDKLGSTVSYTTKEKRRMKSGADSTVQCRTIE